MNLNLVPAAGVPFPSSLKLEWGRLLDKSRGQSPYVAAFWSETWLEHFGKDLQPQFLQVRDPGGDLTGLGLFCPTEIGGKKGLTLLGSEDVWDYRDLIVEAGREEEVWETIGGFFRQASLSFLELSGISESSPTFRHLPPVMRASGFEVGQQMLEPCIYVDLPPTWEEFISSLNSKDRHELRRKQRRLERDAAYEITVQQDALISAAMERFFRLHQISKAEKAEFMKPEMKAYFVALASRLQRDGALDLSFLRIESRDAAALFSFIYNGTEYLYNSGYDPQFGRFSPGIILAAQQVGDAIRKGVKRFNFLKGREDYKYRLGGREEQVYRIRVSKL